MKNQKAKISLVLLITLAFLMPAAPLLADTPTGPDADAVRFSRTNPVTTDSSGIVGMHIEDGYAVDGIAPLEYNNGWPVQVQDILIDPIIAEGSYDITARFQRPDYSDGIDWTVIAVDDVMETPPGPATDSCDVAYREDTNVYSVTSVYTTTFDLSIETNGLTGEVTLIANNPVDIAGRWDTTGERVCFYYDADSDGTADWALAYYYGGTFSYWTYAGSWTSAPVPGTFSTNYDTINKEFEVSWIGDDLGSVACHFSDYSTSSSLWIDSVVPCATAELSGVRTYVDADDTSAYLSAPEFANLPLTISMKSDCEFIYIEFVSGGETIETIDLFTQGGNNFDENDATGIGTNTVLFTISREDLRVGDCNQLGFWIEYNVDEKNQGEIARSIILPLISYDCGPTEIKKFLEIYKKRDIPGNESVTEDIYCEDFEDPCEFYDVWATFDMKPDWGDNGALDTWTWTDRRANSPTHSFRSTSFETYLGNQLDYLVFNSEYAELDFSAYDQVVINFAHWMEGDAIMVGDTLTIQDGGYVEYRWDYGTWTSLSETYYDNDWTDESFTILNEGTVLEVRFVFFSDPAFCYEGWYVDDFCLDGIINGTEDDFTYDFVMDSHSHEQIMEGEFLDHTFIEDWDAVEGEYLICVWLQTLDDCHYSEHGSGEPGYADPFCIEVIVDNILELELNCSRIEITPENPAWEGDDVNVSVDVCNIGTLDAEDVQVKMTVQRGTYETGFVTGFEGLSNEPDGYLPYWSDTEDYPENWTRSKDTQPGRSLEHFTDYETSEGTLALANFNEQTAQPWRYDYTGYGSDYCRGPLDYDISWYDKGWTVSFDSKVNIGAGESFRFGVWDWDLGSGYFYYLEGPIYWDWQTLSFDASSLIGSLIDGGSVPGNRLALGFLMTKDDTDFFDPACPWSDEWSGFIVDNIYEETLIAQEEIIFEQVIEIPEINITTCETINFLWPETTVGQYVLTFEILTEDYDDGNNKCITPYNVINYRQDFDDGTIEFVDDTGTGPGHWMVDDCCQGSLWAGDPATTMYGNNWDDVLYIAPDGNISIPDAAGKYLDFNTFHQLSDNDVGYVEASTDGGLHWSAFVTIIGNSAGTDPEGEDQWNPVHALIPAGTDQIRFRFVSNNSTTNRGWMIDDVFIDGIIDDDCSSLDNFIASEHSWGNWWQNPSVYYAQFGMCAEDAFWYWLGWLDSIVYDPGPPVVTYWQAFGLSALPDCAPAELTYGCYDLTTGVYAWGGGWSYPGGYTPSNLDNSMDWTINTDKVFFGWLDAGWIADFASGDNVEYLVKADDGAFTPFFDKGTASQGTMNVAFQDEEMGETTTFRTRVTTDDTPNPEYDGATNSNWVFNGMKDLNAPTTTASLQGTFDAVYSYYTSEVAVTLTASDDVSGVAATYYELDGVQQTYTRPFVVEGDGEHTLCYWSVDNEGNVEAKKCVAPFKIDESGPSITITGPQPGIHILGRKLLDSDKYIFLFGPIEVTATVSVDDAPLATVEFYLNDVLMGEDTSAPYKLKISEKNNGPATIKVVAKDVLGESDTDTLEIDNYVKLF